MKVSVLKAKHHTSEHDFIQGSTKNNHLFNALCQTIQTNSTTSHKSEPNETLAQRNLGAKKLHNSPGMNTRRIKIHETIVSSKPNFREPHFSPGLCVGGGRKIKYA